MATSLTDFLQSSRGRTQRKSPFEGCRPRRMPLRPGAANGSSDLYFRNYSSCTENDAYTSKMSLDFEQKVRRRSLQKSKWTDNYHKSIEEESRQIKCLNWTPAHNVISETPAVHVDSKTFQDVEKALEIGMISVKQLKTMEEMLQQLITEAKLEEGKIASDINAKFEELITSLNSRKRKLETELIMNSSYYVTAVHGVQISVTEKRSNLEKEIKRIKQMKASHSLKSCNINQVIHELQVSIEEELLKLENLKKKALPCFDMDCEEIISVFENMGKFSYDIPNMHNFGGSPLALNLMEWELKNSMSTEINVKLKPVAEEISVVASLQNSDPFFEESRIQIQDISPSSTHKWIADLPQTDSTPDVIIEEIFEDDQEKSPELVIVSCVVNPCHFYVRKTSKKKIEVHLEKLLRQFCNSKSSSPSDILEIGTRIFVKSKEHGMWCRADIIQLIPPQNTSLGKPCGPTKYKICDIAMMKVFLIDFGHPEAIIVSGVSNEVIVNPEHITLEYLVTEDLCAVVRKPDSLVDIQFRGISKLALRCSLKDIVPKHATEGWKREARIEFLRMINNKAVLMKVFREENNVLIVDLMKPAANKISSDMPVSLRDALVFLDLARFRTELSDRSESNIPLQYFPPVIPQENEEVAAVVSYINSPGDFYIQLLEKGPEFAVFLNKVEEVYKNERETNLEIICPVQGQPCVAKFDNDGIWYRAQVIGLPGHREVEVKYVDFGNTAKINVKGMRKIKDEFLTIPAKAIRCKLAFIEPSKGTKEWSNKSKDKFQELIQDKCMLCFVKEKSQDNVLSVELYDCSEVTTKLSCSVNNILVKEGLASYLTSDTKITTIPHSEVWDPALEEIITKGRDVLKHENEDLSELEVLKLDCNKELEVRINHVVSPAKIFVNFMSSEQILKSLQEKLAATYVGSENETVQWTVDMTCAVYVCDLNQWQRGQILRIVSEKNVEVFLFDLGTAKMVDTACLRGLKEDLKTVKPLAVECSLKDIRPAGGTEQWTATACDVLASYLAGALATLIIQENNSSPLPVKILSKYNGECTDISEYMIKKGLALRNRRPPQTDLPAASSSVLHEMPFQQNDADINNVLTKTECDPVPSVPEKDADPSLIDSEEEELETLVSQPVTTEAYKPPALPNPDNFTAIVSCVSDDGTIYVIPKSQEQQRRKLMSDMQDNFKYLGLLEPYNWKMGEACVVRAADTMWYRGVVREVGIGIIKVQYLDYGYIERIPQCHLYPTVLYADIPPFSIPCELSNVVPIGNVWQQDAVELLQELLTERLVEIHIMERPENLWGKVSIKLFFAGMSLSSFMAYHKHCVSEDDDGSRLRMGIVDCSENPLEENCEINHEELLPEVGTPLLPSYSSPSLPVLGQLFPVQISHIVSPNEVYISIVQTDSTKQHSKTKDRGNEWDSKMLEENLDHYNKNADSLSFLTDFRNDMPCLAQYTINELWYRAKILSIQKFHPLSILVQFVDFGTTQELPTSRLRQIPPQLMQYPTRAFKVLLTGFKPAVFDPALERIPYCPDWTMKALWDVIKHFEGKLLHACSLTYSPEHTVFLYENGNPFHIKLVEMGLAELI